MVLHRNCAKVVGVYACMYVYMPVYTSRGCTLYIVILHTCTILVMKDRELSMTFGELRSKHNSEALPTFIYQVCHFGVPCFIVFDFTCRLDLSPLVIIRHPPKNQTFLMYQKTLFHLLDSSSLPFANLSNSTYDDSRRKNTICNDDDSNPIFIAWATEEKTNNRGNNNHIHTTQFLPDSNLQSLTLPKLNYVNNINNIQIIMNVLAAPQTSIIFYPRLKRESGIFVPSHPGI